MRVVLEGGWRCGQSEERADGTAVGPVAGGAAGGVGNVRSRVGVAWGWGG